ncbi:gas vesicle protein GvpO [Pseudonocardia xishanensis]|uniref:Gas vesicle protein GvpO n=1 Tax=Pseudonocardia xishanensis TaxID=630995 RepID=A0ABP8RSF1_9PSEU
MGDVAEDEDRRPVRKRRPEREDDSRSGARSARPRRRAEKAAGSKERAAAEPDDTDGEIDDDADIDADNTDDGTDVEPEPDDEVDDQVDDEVDDRASGRVGPRSAARRNGAARGRRSRVLPVDAARRAAEQIVALTGRELESVVSIEGRDDGWLIGIEVVETRRIPDSADILALFEVQVNDDGDLTGYRRAGRYGRGQLHKGGR